MASRTSFRLLLVSLLFILSQSTFATKLDTVKVLDKDYIMLHFIDGKVDFVDDGVGQKALTNFAEANNAFVVNFGSPLNLTNAVTPASFIIKSDDDSNYGTDGIMPDAVYRKSKVNGMKQGPWGTNDWVFDYTNEHFIYLKLPHSMIENNTYTIEIVDSINSDKNSASIIYDIFNCPSEAIHINLVGYMDRSGTKGADLYYFLGDGGNRDYSEFEGNEVFIYNVDTEERQSIGQVSFWMNNKRETYHNLTGSDVWNIDFSGFAQPGTYRIAVEGIGCSENFEIKNDIYHTPYKLGVLGYFYMRIGQDNLDMAPIPRRPLYIQDVDPSNCKIYVTDMSPYHPNWNTFTSGDKWDSPTSWAAYKKEGSPTNPRAIGGHSDALDWDRHLGHVVNIYDLCLAYILSDGSLDDDDLRIAESGNGIPDILDEARNEVDFWLNLRYKGGYSHGLTNPDNSNRLYQADNTPIAAWANALNSSMLAYCFQIAGENNLRKRYLDSAFVAFNYANNLPDPMYDTNEEGIRGIDFKMMSAAYLYNLTGDTLYENIVAEESVVTGPNSDSYQQDSYNQLWGTAAYILTKRAVNYPELQADMKSSVIANAYTKETDKIDQRPSRRGYSSEQAWWQTNEDMPRTILAHAVSDNPIDQHKFLDALELEAGWGLGRNPLNMIQMTTASTELENIRSVENCYTAGQDDGTPGLFPGHTPYLNIEGWGGEMVGSNPKKVLEKFYPDYEEWPHASLYINTQYIWTHSEFTPRQTMRGKALLYAYLYSLSKSNNPVEPVLFADAGRDIRVVDKDEDGKEEVTLDGSGSFSNSGEIVNYEWSLYQTVLDSGMVVSVEFATGSYYVVLKVEREDGEVATDTVKVEVVLPSAESSDYDFETPSQLEDWESGNLGDGGSFSIEVSGEQAHSGSYSAKLSGDFSSNSQPVFRRNGTLEDNVESIIYYLWIPQELVDSSKAVALTNPETSGGIQNYLMFTGWQWRSQWVNLTEMQGNAWNKIEYQIPDDVANSEILQTGLAITMQGVNIGQNSVYIDDIIYQVPAQPADYDFETSEQLDQWIVEDFSQTTGSPSASRNSEVVHGGQYSFEMEGNFAAGTENALRRNASLPDNITSLEYHIWVPQELVYSANDLYQTDSTQVGVVQVYLMHDGWQWISDTYSFKDLNGGGWTKVTLNIPDEVQNSLVQAFGVTFKTNGVDIGRNSVYIDDIYLIQSGEPTGNEKDEDIPRQFELFNNYPNPFNPSTRIKYYLPVSTEVKLNVYDIIGSKVATLVNGFKKAGSYEINFDASHLASGVYVYSIIAYPYRSTKKMLLLK
jgi:endoglucanase